MGAEKCLGMGSGRLDLHLTTLAACSTEMRRVKMGKMTKILSTSIGQDNETSD